MPERIENAEEHFWSQVNKNAANGCWEWTGKSRTGYGSFNLIGLTGTRRHTFAHRYTYEKTFGTIPAGMFVCHKCDNPPCCNPDHLFLGTLQDNKRDEVEKKRHAHGVKNGNAKLTEADVLKIRELHREGWSLPELARKFSVRNTTIHWVVSRGTWKHI